MRVAFNRAALRGKEHDYLREAISGGHLSGDGPFTKRVEALLETGLGAPKVLLTQSGTAALEIAALLTVKLGDEVIVPSFTFPTTASAFVRCGATPVFVDILRDTFNIDPRAVQAAVTPRTRAIVAVHYAGVGCDMDALRDIAKAANAVLIEDNAHGCGARYRGRPLGSFGHLSATSFHATKNVTSGEGGALVLNDPKFIERAQFIRDRGTDWQLFKRNEVEEYSWVEIGSAYAPSDLLAAFLLAQIEDIEQITLQRRKRWTRYHEALEVLERDGCARRPLIPAAAEHNGHIYHLLLDNASRRRSILSDLNQGGVNAVTHFVPLHSSRAGLQYGRTAGSLAVTEDIAPRLIRLPMHLSMTLPEQDQLINSVIRLIGRGRSATSSELHAPCRPVDAG
ncbi:MAG: dTDP-4-amino-4,6-dideoxygalactose transaminase [Alphaproteobacteria bacterium]|nr:dTDP-4-amino-4,6-dideoxygalactose transaminase [Alphaproteobacteria bacterium]